MRSTAKKNVFNKTSNNLLKSGNFLLSQMLSLSSLHYWFFLYIRQEECKLSQSQDVPFFPIPFLFGLSCQLLKATLWMSNDKRTKPWSPRYKIETTSSFSLVSSFIFTSQLLQSIKKEFENIFFVMSLHYYELQYCKDMSSGLFFPVYSFSKFNSSCSIHWMFKHTVETLLPFLLWIYAYNERRCKIAVCFQSFFGGILD